MRKEYNIFMPKSPAGYFPNRYIDFTYDENNPYYNGIIYDMQGIEIDRGYTFTEKQIETNLSNKVYLLVEDSLPLQVAAGRVIVSIGQLTKKQINQLNRAVKRGLIQKGLGGSFPKVKTVFAPLGYDIQGNRQKDLDTILNHSYSGIFENNLA